MTPQTTSTGHFTIGFRRCGNWQCEMDALIAWGEWAWRYAIPGSGMADWPEIFRVLAGHDYRGCVCIEMEDCNFGNTEAGEKLGLTKSLEFLKGC